jgi:hypothetical protein
LPFFSFLSLARFLFPLVSPLSHLTLVEHTTHYILVLYPSISIA